MTWKAFLKTEWKILTIHAVLYVLCLAAFIIPRTGQAEERRPTSLVEEEEKRLNFIHDVIDHYNSGEAFPKSISKNIIWESLVGTNTDIIFTYTLLKTQKELSGLNFANAARIDKGDVSCGIFSIDIEELEAVVHRYYDIDHVFFFEVEFTEYDCMLF